MGLGGGESISRSSKGRGFGMGGWWWRRRGRMSPATGGGRRRRRASAAVICCSPVLLPLLCLCLPFLCVAAACLRVGRPKRAAAAAAEESGGGGGGGAVLGRCEEGEGEGEEEEGRLLQRYLEDQLGLVGALWDCDESVRVVGGGGDRF